MAIWPRSNKNSGQVTEPPTDNPTINFSPTTTPTPLSGKRQFFGRRLWLFTVLFAIIGGFALFFSFAASPNPLTSPNQIAAATTDLPTSTIHSVAFYYFPKGSGTSANVTYLQQQLPAIKAAGFNTVFLITPWVNFESNINPVTYNEQAFDYERQALQVIKDAGMRAIALTHQFGPGWQPLGITRETWLSDPLEFSAYENFVDKLLNEIKDYSDMTYPAAFTENTMEQSPTCDIYHVKTTTVINNCPAKNGTTYSYCGIPDGATVPDNCLSDAKAHAALLRSTLGSLPDWLEAHDPAIRAKFKLLLHDGRYIIANKYIPEDYDYMPIAKNNGWDILSFTNYEPQDFTDTPGQLEQSLDGQVQRYKDLFPAKQVIVGEFGASMCAPIGNLDYQASIDSFFVSYALAHQLGFNIWGWNSGPGDCTNHADSNHLALHNFDGSPRPALAAISQSLTPQATTDTVNANGNPWTVTVTGKQLSTTLAATVYDHSGNVWTTTTAVGLSAGGQKVTFSLPSLSPPSGCNRRGSCRISMRLSDTYTGYTSGRFTLYIPRAARPSIRRAWVTPTSHPRLVRLNGFLYDGLKVNIYDVNGRLWARNMAVSTASDDRTGTFWMPGLIPPSRCNIGHSCVISARLYDPLSGYTSPAFRFLIVRAR